MWLGSGIAVAVGRPAATAPIPSLALQPPCAMGGALKRQKKKTKRKKKERKVNEWTGTILMWTNLSNIILSKYHDICFCKANYRKRCVKYALY